MTVTLLVDADVIAVRAALYCETTFDFGDGEFKEYHPEELPEYIDDELESYRKKLKADRVICCLSSYPNFRESIFPSYKGKRGEKPKLVDEAKDYIRETYEVMERPNLEGDDVMGILSTHPKLIKGKKIIVSVDKDMQTIPGYLFNPDKDTKVRKITKEAADRFWIKQTLIGDTVDCYPGCPGIGEKTVDEWLDSPYINVSYEHEFKAGPRKGKKETRWRRDPVDTITWESVVSFFEKAGLTEQEALTQSRVARILRHTDYDFKNKRVAILDKALM